MSIAQRNDARVVTVDPSLRAILRFHTLSVLELNHEPFEDIHDLPAAELLPVAAVFRDALTILDTIHWLPGAHDTEPADVPITPGHVTQLARLRTDLALSVLEELEAGEDLAETTTHRDAAAELLALIRACD